ncbi:MAG: sigma 54-interacting transcriptional regulator [Planctomycetaceae bacterium]
MNAWNTTDSAVGQQTPRLLVQHADERRETLRLSRTLRHTIGRAHDNWLKLSDTGCSRHHCTIEWTGGQWVISDLGSSNGTQVDLQNVRRCELEDGSLILIGRTWFRFSYETEEDYIFPADARVDAAETDHGFRTNDPENAQSLGENKGKTSTIRDATGVSGRPQANSDDPSTEIGIEPPELESTISPIVQKPLPNRAESSSAGFGELQRRKFFPEMIGDSPTMQVLRETISMLATTDAGVLLLGETGVGKELVAYEIHRLSRRSSGPYVCVNCAALSESLLESELFGHEKGSFTGATERRLGKFEQADGGTLVLDEIGEMSPTIQAKFLRVLDGHAFERVGGNIPIRVNVRVIAATNRNLEQAVARGEFRRDLYFRLNVLDMTIPPLRERRADIPTLANHFLKIIALRAHVPAPKLTTNAIERLTVHDWPGNVRELKNLLERAFVFAKDGVIDIGDLRFPVGAVVSAEEAGVFQEQSLQAVELQHIVRTLDATDWNKSRASQILGIERSTLDRKLKRYRIRRPKPKTTIIPANPDDSDVKEEFDDVEE